METNDAIRSVLKNDFLKNYFANSEFEIHKLPADASFRTYDRIMSHGQSFILMDCPPIYYSLKPFIKVARILRENKFSAPAIYKEDHENGLLLLEDFGKLSIGAHLLLEQDLQTTDQIYKTIIDLLVELQNIKTTDELELYDDKTLLKELEIYLEWYVPYKRGKPLLNEQKKEFLKLWQDILQKLPSIKPCLVLRDYHVENMMLLNLKGIKAIGLLDFQDAVIGHPLYDLVSLLEDARIDVSNELSMVLLDYYLAKKNDVTREDGLTSYHILAAQRNLRILGVFVRKAVRDNQENYLKYISRLLRYLEFDLSLHILTPIREWIKNNV